MVLEIIKFMIYSVLIVIISKNILVKTLRKLAENLNLKPTTVGNVAGIATSVPELLTISASSLKGLIGMSIVNVLSSNIINFIQYFTSITLNKNYKAFKNKAIKLDVFFVIITIILPILLISFDVDVNITIVPIFIICYLLIHYLNKNSHKLYLREEEEELAKQIEKEKKWEIGNKKKTIKYTIYLLLTGILLFVIGELLGNTLEVLCVRFDISEIIIGVLLGFITSIPELITFFEAQKHYKSKKNANELLGVVEATNNLLTSNIMNLFVIQSIGVILYTLLFGFIH